MIALLGAVRAETDCVLPDLAAARRIVLNNVRMWQGLYAEQPVLLAQTGMGRGRAEAALAALLAYTPVERVISFGFAGALDSALTVGDVLLVDRVMTATGGTPDGLPEVAREAVQRVLAAIQAAGPPLVAGALVTAEQVVGAPEAKQALALASGAPAVDMESYWIARAAAACGLPFVGLRVISDAAGDWLPPFDQWHGWSGAGQALRYFAARPGRVLAVVRLSQHVRQAQRSLRAALRAVIPAVSGLDG